MDVTPLIKSGTNIIQSYQGGRFQISGRFFDSAIIVTPEEVIEWKTANGVAVENLETLTIEGFAAAQNLRDQYDVFLLGTGAQMQFLPRNINAALTQPNISFDCMATGAACRTYNVLMAEGRRVAAFLFPARAENF